MNSILKDNILKNKLKNLFNILKKYNSFIVTGHINPDGDIIGSLLVLKELLLFLKKKFLIILSDPVPNCYNFVKDVNYIKSLKNIESKEFSDYECVIIMDCSDLNRVGDLLNYLPNNKFIINIDHHIDNTSFGNFNLVYDKASSIGELLYYFFEVNKIEINNNIANYLYLSIITDTGSFKYDNMHPEVHLIASNLLKLGVIPYYYNINLYLNKSFSYIKLVKTVLNRMELFENNKIVISSLFYEDFENIDDDETEGIIDYLGMLDQAVIYCLFKEKIKGTISVSLRSKSDINVAEIAHHFGGGGHKKAAGCRTSNMSFEEFKNAIISKIKEYLK